MVFASPLRLFASGGIPQVALNVSQASPGATIEVTGGRFEPDAVVTFVLAQAEKQIQLGTVIADDHGEFTAPILLPFDLAYGQYEFQAIDEQHRITKADLTVSPDSGDVEDSEQRGEDEPLLAPMPAQVTPTGHTNTALTADTTASRPATEIEPPIPIALLFGSALVIVILVAGLFVFSRRSR